MSKKCPWCDSIGSLVNDAEFEGRLYCKNCKTSILMGEELDCNLFDRITASPEVLAEKLVHEAIIVDEFGGHYGCYKSTIVGGRWFKKSEAIAATVAKLKEVAE